MSYIQREGKFRTRDGKLWSIGMTVELHGFSGRTMTVHGYVPEANEILCTYEESGRKFCLPFLPVTLCRMDENLVPREV